MSCSIQLPMRPSTLRSGTGIPLQEDLKMHVRRTGAKQCFNGLSTRN